MCETDPSDEAAEPNPQAAPPPSARFIAFWEAKRDWFARIIRRRLDRRLTRRLDEADLLQELYLDLAGRYESVQNESEAPNEQLLRIIARQKVDREHRRHLDVAARDVRREVSIDGPRVGESNVGGPMDWVDAGIDTPSTQLARTERCDLVIETLRRLPPADREILTLRDLEGLSNDECAARLGLSKAAASNRHHRAKERFRRLIGDHPAVQE